MTGHSGEIGSEVTLPVLIDFSVFQTRSHQRPDAILLGSLGGELRGQQRLFHLALCELFAGPAAQIPDRLNDGIPPGGTGRVQARHVRLGDLYSTGRGEAGIQQQVDVQPVNILQVQAGSGDAGPVIECEGELPKWIRPIPAGRIRADDHTAEY